MPFTDSQSGYRARCKLGGLRRAAYWAAQGFPNLVRARAAKARKQLERLQREEWALARSVNPFALPQDAALWASVAREQRGQPSPRRQTAREGSLVEEIRRARAAAAQATATPYKLTKRPRGY